MTLCGTLYEVTNFASFVHTYVMASRRPDSDSVRPLKDGWITLCRGEGTAFGSSLPLRCRTDGTGCFELDLSQAPDAPVFVVASGSEELRENCWYRSTCVRPVALDRHLHQIYVARATIPDECGFSQAELAAILALTKKQVADLEQITGTITPGGIALKCLGKGARASGRLVLNPDLSGDLTKVLRHSIDDFQLELPGPAWLTGLLVSKDAIEESIRAGVRTLVGQLNERLRLRAIEAFTSQVADTDSAVAVRLAATATVTFERLRYPIIARPGGASGDRAIVGDVCLGFPRTLQLEGPR